jgi:hypothetical protein
MKAIWLTWNLYCSQRTEREGDAMHNETSDA